MSVPPSSQKTGTLSLPCREDELDRFISRPFNETSEALNRVDGDYLVLGAAGKMGLHLCLMLKAALAKIGSAARVVAVSRFRSINSRTAFESQGIETLSGDLTDDAFLESLPLFENLFYLVGAKFGTSDRPDLLKRINIQLPSRVAKRFTGSRIVALSTGCVYPYVVPENRGSREGDELDPVGEYARSCVGREEAFVNVSKEFGTQISLIRLNYSVELRYGVLVDIANWVKKGKEVPLANGWVNVIWQGDALNQIVRSLEFAETPPRAINITGKETLSVRKIAQGFAERFGEEAKFTGVESSDAWLSDASWAEGNLGSARVTVSQMMDWIAAWLNANFETFRKPTGFHRRDGQF